MSGSARGLKLFLSREATVPRWLRRAMRREKNIRIRHEVFRKGKRARCLVIPFGEARLLREGGCIEIKVPGEMAFQNGLYTSDVLEIQDFAGRPVIVNVLLCTNCMLPTGIRLQGRQEIVCSCCRTRWTEDPALPQEAASMVVSA